ncbi:hypothetical protein DL89DRAFT_327620 [Linderina pennispora]|uniref:Protein phosphatase n=1 Tax=Linderina pennispora TaxID=61395 RepID=A0A1Y1VQ87_9FUNG|nr:uncharacterized protein DL89DRAFT_327620 [Linderina pennispora]ORX63478.1 hypothetical protein DL89DRAFT_327620 [Linderina pennispora]
MPKEANLEPPGMAQMLVRYETVVINDSTPYKRRERAYSGDDSMFHARNRDTLVFGVADGVGGWKRRGISSARFSRSLTAYSAHAVARVQDGNPKEIMHKAVAAMKYDGIPVYGSSTETIASLSLKTGTLHLAQLGDSRSIVLNCRQEAVFVSPGQVHSPNMPYQISFRPPKDTNTSYGSASGQVDDLCYYRPRKDYSLLTDGAEREIIRNLKRQKTDTPRDALEEIVYLAHNNMAIIATDGLFDNMDPELIVYL